MKDLLKQICERHGLNLEAFDDGQEYEEGIVQFMDGRNELVVDLEVYKQKYSVIKFNGLKLFSGTWKAVLV